MDNLNEIKETLKDMFKAAITNAKDGDEKGEWITIKGTHVFIPEGKTAEDVIKEKGWEEKGEGKKQAEDEPVKLDVADKPTKEAQEAIDRERQRTQRIAEERKKEYEKSKDIDLTKLKLDNPSEGKKGYSLSKEYKNHVQFEGDKESGGYPRKIHKDLESAKKFYEYKKEGQDGAEKQNLKEKGKRGIPVRDYPVIVKNPLGDGFVVATHGLAQKHDLTEVYPVNREDKVKNGLSEIIKNCKPETKEDLKILKGLKNILEEQ